jgi:hypothetical protein
MILMYTYKTLGMLVVIHGASTCNKSSAEVAEVALPRRHILQEAVSMA